MPQKNTGVPSIVSPVERSLLQQEDLAEYAIDFTACRVHDALQTLLPGAAANDDMGLITGTPGTDAPTLQGVDFGGASSDEKCAFFYPLPPEYQQGQTVQVRVRAGMVTTVADTSCDVDVEVWKFDGDGAVGSDLCNTSATDMNDLSKANLDFDVTATTLAPGDVLMCRVSFVGTDSGNAGVMIPEISKLALLLDIKG